MKTIKTFVGALALGLAAMTFGASAQDKGTVGIAMPTQVVAALDLRRQRARKAALEAKGYTADLQYAEDDIPNQLAQIENMVTKGAKALSSPRSTARRCRPCCSRPPTPASRSSPMTA